MEAAVLDQETILNAAVVDVEPVDAQRSATVRLAELAGHRNAVDAAIVDVVADVMDSDAWAVDGIRSAQHWLCWQLGITTSEAQRLLGLAAARTTHPHLSALFDAGRLSLTQAAIATSVDPTRDGEIADVVVACTIPQLRLFARAMANADRHAQQPADAEAPADDTEPETPDGPAPVEPTPAPPPQPERKSSLEFWFDDDGRLVGRFDLDTETGRLVDMALRHARDLLFHRRNDAVDPDTDRHVTATTVSWADALAEIARRSLDTDESPARRQRFRINLFLDPATNYSQWDDHRHVPDCLADKLTCDGTLTPTFVEAGQPVSVGRALRIVPDRTRRLVTYRDHHHCRIPWCERRRRLDIHHIIHWTHGGPTDTANLIAICDTCHQAIHDGRLHITGNADDPDGLTYTDRTDHPINYQTPTPPQPTGPPPQPTQPYTHPLGERLNHRDISIHPSKAT